MEIFLSVNGRNIDRIEVRNRGPVDDTFEPGDYPGGPGERVYDWRACDGRGTVRHRRADGARALAAKVLEASKIAV